MRFPKAGLWLTAFVAAVCIATGARAGEYIGPRKILDLGCHNTDGTCYVTLDGSAFGSTLGCVVGSITEFRFDNGDTADGRRAYASFLSASIAGKSISVYLDGCTVQGYAKLVYFRVAS
jgi:hypothetical protein